MGEYFCLYVHASIYYSSFCFPSGHCFEQGKISQLLLMLLHIPAHPLYSAAADLSFVGVQRHVPNHFLSSLLSALILTFWGFHALLSGPLPQVFTSLDWQREKMPGMAYRTRDEAMRNPSGRWLRECRPRRQEWTCTRVCWPGRRHEGCAKGSSFRLQHVQPTFLAVWAQSELFWIVGFS